MDDIWAQPTFELVKRIFSHVPEALVLTDLDRHVRHINAAAEATFGFAPAEVLGRSTRLFYAREVEFQAQGVARFRHHAGVSDDATTVEYQRADGSCFPGRTYGGPICDSAGEPVAFVAFVIDDTARERGEQAIVALQEITSDPSLSLQARIQAMLRLGARHFGLPIGLQSRIDGNTYIVEHAEEPVAAVEVGARLELDQTYCAETIGADRPVGFHHVGRSSLSTHPCYRQSALEAYLGAPIHVASVPYGTLSFAGPTPRAPFSAREFQLIRLFARWIGYEIEREANLTELREARNALQTLASTDPLTGLWNRREGTLLVDHELRRGRRDADDAPSVLLADLDEFKKLNDAFGHQTGDRMLVAFADAARRGVRERDEVARWGGEEFLLLLSATAAAGALHAGQRLCDAVRALRVPDEDGVPRGLTVSIGTATWRPGDTIDSLLSRADRALYAAKSAGRNRVLVSEE